MEAHPSSVEPARATPVDRPSNNATQSPHPLVPGAPILGLTGVRFAAAMGVVLCHFGYLAFPGPPILLRLMSGMFNAVGFFFMLSGFILAHTYGERLMRGDTPPGRFYRARLARLYPAYLFALAFSLPDFFVTHAERSWARVAEWSAVKLPMLQTWIPGSSKYVNSWNPPTWSISTELFFYLAFPLVVRPIMRLDTRRTLLLFGIVAFSMSAVALACDLVWVTQDGPDIPLRTFLIMSPLPRLADFCLGIATYRLANEWVSRYQTTATSRWAWPLVGVGLLLLLASGLHVAKSQGLTYLVFGLLLILLASGEGRITAFFSRPSLVQLGEESYALYLVHMPVASYLARIGNRLGHPPASSYPAGLAFVIATIVVSILLARLVHRYVETPGRRLLMGARSRAARV